MKRLPRDNEEALDQYWEGKWQDDPEPEEGRVFWCNAHERLATHFDDDGTDHSPPVCDPRLGGILLPCRCVELTGIAEIIEDKEPKPKPMKNQQIAQLIATDPNRSYCVQTGVWKYGHTEEMKTFHEVYALPGTDGSACSVFRSETGTETLAMALRAILASKRGWRAAELRVVCQVKDCAKVMQEGIPGAPVSHGLCPECEPVFLARMEEELKQKP